MADPFIPDPPVVSFFILTCAARGLWWSTDKQKKALHPTSTVNCQLHKPKLNSFLNTKFVWLSEKCLCFTLISLPRRKAVPMLALIDVHTAINLMHRPYFFFFFWKKSGRTTISTVLLNSLSTVTRVETGAVNRSVCSANLFLNVNKCLSGQVGVSAQGCRRDWIAA